MSDIRFNQWLHNSGTGGVSQVDGGHVGIGTTNPLIPVGSGNTAILNVGVVTANSFYGDGSNLSGVQVGGASSLSFNDNIGAYFGNSQDLKIYHDGNHSYIDDQGTGNLRFRSGTLEILNLAGNKTSAIFSSGGGQTLNFNNSTKLVTTDNGLLVSGITTSNSGFMFGTDGEMYLYKSAANTTSLRITSDGPYAEFKDVSGDVQMGSASGALRISAGGSQKLHITTAGKLLVGATSGSNHYISSGSDTLNTVFQANLGGAGATCAIRVKMNTSANDGLQIQQNGSGTAVAGGAHCASIFNRENAPLRLGTNNSERLRISANGEVTKPNHPVFSGAYVGSASANFGTSEFTMNFNTVMINQGNHYNTSTGEYTCPVAGKYWMSAQAHLQPQSGGAYTTFRLQKNGGLVSNAWKADGSGGTLFAHCIVSCAANDVLRVRVLTTDSTQYTAERYWVASIYLMS